MDMEASKPLPAVATEAAGALGIVVDGKSVSELIHEVHALLFEAP